MRLFHRSNHYDYPRDHRLDASTGKQEWRHQPGRQRRHQLYHDDRKAAHQHYPVFKFLFLFLPAAVPVPVANSHRFSDEELTHMLDQIDAILPIGQDEWSPLCRTFDTRRPSTQDLSRGHFLARSEGKQ
jgi:hypothetical protein